MYCLKSPKGRLVIASLCETKADCWSSWAWHAPVTQQRAASWTESCRSIAKKFGWSVVRVDIVERKN